MTTLLVTAVALMTTLTTGPGHKEPSIENLGWLKGNWSCPQFGGIFEEHWIGPSGGTMQGCGKLVVDGKTAFMEYMSLESENGVITMWMLLGAPSKGEKKGVPFRMTSLTGNKAVFENPANEFPSKITYELEQKERLACSIEGMQQGKHTVEKFAFRPIK